jgi:hypothetical protein
MQGTSQQNNTGTLEQRIDRAILNSENQILLQRAVFEAPLEHNLQHLGQPTLQLERPSCLYRLANALDGPKVCIGTAAGLGLLMATTIATCVLTQNEEYCVPSIVSSSLGSLFIGSLAILAPTIKNYLERMDVALSEIRRIRNSSGTGVRSNFIANSMSGNGDSNQGRGVQENVLPNSDSALQNISVSGQIVQAVEEVGSHDINGSRFDISMRPQFSTTDASLLAQALALALAREPAPAPAQLSGQIQALEPAPAQLSGQIQAVEPAPAQLSGQAQSPAEGAEALHEVAQFLASGLEYIVASVEAFSQPRASGIDRPSEALLSPRSLRAPVRSLEV